MCRFDRIMAAFDRGDSVEAVASAYGLDRRTAMVYELAAHGENAIITEDSQRSHVKWHKFGADEKQMIVDQWRRCGSIIKTANALGLSENSVRGLLYREGQRSRGNHKLSDDQKAQAVELYVGGMSCPAVAQEMGVGCATMYKMLKRRGVIRPKNGAVDKSVDKGVKA